ncbi:MAG: FAD-dependent oxidoreductase [Candidatus Latescibacteria bacterium]|nr:FAD-dependent oxidoreductase [Candidatus Latescibacterota bacterium]
MPSTTYLLIGGGLASSQAAKFIRKHDPNGAITLASAEPYVPYDRPPLSKEFLRGQKPREDLFFDPEPFFRENRVDLVLGTAVQGLDPSQKTATLANGETIAFEKALIATGGRPVHLKLPGGDLPGVHYLRTLDDSAAIASEASPGKRAVLIGAGFIGMEVAASLTQQGVRVTVVEVAPHIWARFADATLAGFFQDYCAQQGIVFLTNEMVTEMRGDGHVSSVVTKSGIALPCDFVCIGVGIVPNVELAQQAGLAVNNGIVVNEYLQTSHPDIYAAGDVANYLDPVFRKRRRVEHWGHAEYCGQIAGMNMAGAQNTYDLLTYVWSDIFDLHLEFAGDESEHDQVLIRGRMEDNSFIALYLKQHVLMAYFAINTNAREFIPLQRLIRRKVDLSGKETQLQDPTVALKGLL